jgi:sporulation protein YlmC with PRC-barrel domain
MPEKQEKPKKPETWEVRVEHLLGRRVLDRHGKAVGRIEEVRAEPLGRETLVTEFLIGRYAMLERLSLQAFLAAPLHLLGWGRKRGGYRVPWDRLDLGDPERPKLRCGVEELEKLGD